LVGLGRQRRRARAGVADIRQDWTTWEGESHGRVLGVNDDPLDQARYALELKGFGLIVLTVI
jgi:hypothetical protein